MRALVVAASRHGATREIAQAVAEELRCHGVDSELLDATVAMGMTDLEKYDAVVLGSAVYMGNWLPEARQFFEGHRTTLGTVPLWLFSSGPIGDDPKPHGDPEGIKEILETSGARGHCVFVGKLDKKNLGFAERLAAKVVRSPEGDFRDWDAIREWARGIATSLRLRQPSGVAC